MTEILQENLSKLSINDKDTLKSSETKITSQVNPTVSSRANLKVFTDVTDSFFKIASKIPFGEVVKSNQFKLLEGTHALEILNPKLDSALLDLTDFDISSVKTLDEVNWIMMKLLGCLCSWLDNNSLSVSVLSCVYIQKLLLNYQNLEDPKLTFDEKPNGDVTDVILRAFSLGLLQFVKFVLKLGQSGVIYEEEDLNTQTMDLDFLTKVDVAETDNDLKVAIELIESNYGNEDGCNFCLKMLRLFEELLKCESLLSVNADLYTHSEFDSTFLSRQLQLLSELKDQQTYLDSLKEIPNCFSVNIQRQLNNRSPPKPLSCLPFAVSVESLIGMSNDLVSITKILEITDVIELYEYLTCFMNRRLNTNDPDEIIGNHVVARALMQLFLIRDDRSILGSRKWFISDMMLDLLYKVSLQNSKLSKIDTMPGFEVNDISYQKLLAQLESPFYNYLTSISQNPSRQRQFINKELILWDTLQVEAENFELELNPKLNDNFIDSNIPTMPVSSFVYYFKLVRMIELMFKSIELNLFKDLREINIGYWFLSYLIGYLTQHIVRLLDINRLRQTQISNYPKKIKKAKGDKKLKLKEEYESHKVYLDQFLRVETYLKYQMNKMELYKKLIELKLTTLQILNHQGYLKLSKLCRAPEELLFELQLKSYQSIGIPQLPTFKDYQDSLTKFNEVFDVLYKQKNFRYFKSFIVTKNDEINDDLEKLKELASDLHYNQLLTDDMMESFSLLKTSSLSSQETLSTLLKLLESEGPKALKVTIEKLNYHLYFPNISIELQ
ncbi:hypothetical protein CANARDRAFT_29270 [[Candida] arabinofermentans NRRL YB-2248]|uniref:Uncharacterized protein n=1 Tax=[Candida] arabinofermentans NRRL YB-2248 TaxID=983967 RepID=A0A1E4SY57_9ASCO|nr:hypothetical protein CANARDRAFT_29270 [[Candida] arabinofermentans NRRL YB-2248]